MSTIQTCESPASDSTVALVECESTDGIPGVAAKNYEEAAAMLMSIYGASLGMHIQVPQPVPVVKVNAHTFPERRQRRR